MAGQKGRSGRRRRPGKLYRFTFRFMPGRHPAELEEKLDAIEQAETADERNRLIEGLLIRGATTDEPEQQQPATGEDTYATNLLDTMFDQF